MQTKMNESIEFGIYLTGHSKEDIEQMYIDWNKSRNNKSIAEFNN